MFRLHQWFCALCHEQIVSLVCAISSLVKQNQYTLFSTCMFKTASPTKTMSLFIRFLEEQKHESSYMIILFISMTSLLSFFSILSLGHKFLGARTVFYYVQKLQLAQQDPTLDNEHFFWPTHSAFLNSDTSEPFFWCR